MQWRQRRGGGGGGGGGGGAGELEPHHFPSREGIVNISVMRWTIEHKGEGSLLLKLDVIANSYVYVSHLYNYSAYDSNLLSTEASIVERSSVMSVDMK